MWGALAAALIPSLLGGDHGAGAANRIAESQVAKQNEIIDYLLSKRKRLYDPIEEGTLIPRMMGRATTAPFYAQRALGHASGLRRPMMLPAPRGA